MSQGQVLGVLVPNYEYKIGCLEYLVSPVVLAALFRSSKCKSSEPVYQDTIAHCIMVVFSDVEVGERLRVDQLCDFVESLVQLPKARWLQDSFSSGGGGVVTAT